jgi:hypothetical protein
MRAGMLLACIASGCGLSEDRFQQVYAEEWCALASDCGELASYYEGRSACEEAVLDHLSEATKGCEYDPRAASMCRSELRDATCDDDIEEGVCTDVYTGSCAWSSQAETEQAPSSGGTTATL